MPPYVGMVIFRRLLCQVCTRLRTFQARVEHHSSRVVLPHHFYHTSILCGSLVFLQCILIDRCRFPSYVRVSDTVHDDTTMATNIEFHKPLIFCKCIFYSKKQVQPKIIRVSNSLRSARNQIATKEDKNVRNTGIILKKTTVVVHTAKADK